MPTSQYNQCLESMFKLRRFGIKLGLSAIRHVLTQLGNPQNEFSSIHVAGTNGKGSVASALSTILQKTGCSVGLYTSPHMVKFNERICINGTAISDESVVKSWQAIESVKLSGRKPTFFEFSTAMAFYEFGCRNVDFAIIETGMGGSKDATNIISPILSIITNISLEHKEHLGNTIEQISREKAGIIKPGIPVVSGVTQKNAVTVINETAKRTNSELFLKGRDFKTRKKKDGTFSYFGKHNQWKSMSTSLIGNHQIDNAAITLAACEIINQRHAYISSDSIRSGLSSNKWPGRLEIALKSPCVILDGAHNLMAARNLSRFLASNTNDENVILVVGILDDKPYKNMLKTLATQCSHVIVTRPRTGRALPLKTMEETAKLFSNSVEAIADVGEALAHAINKSAPNDIICVAGSLYVVGEAKVKLKKQYRLS